MRITATVSARIRAQPTRGETRPNVVLPEYVRKLLRERLGFGRFLGTRQKLALSGAAAISGPNATLSPTSLTFSTQAIGTTSAAKTLTLKNTGTTTLTITGIAITGINARDFAQTHTCGSSLAAGANCSISVRFTPAVLGTRTAALSVTDNAAGSPQKVALSGMGVNGGTLTGYCVHGQFVPLLGCRITSDPSPCPPHALAVDPVVLEFASPCQV